MILNGYVYPTSLQVADGVIAPSMAKYELEGLGPQGATDELVPSSSTNESIL